MPTDTTAATVALPDDLEVLSKFECLMKESVAGESIHIRTKETIGQYFKDAAVRLPVVSTYAKLPTLCSYAKVKVNAN